MSYTLTTYLKLRLESTLSANSKYNLQRIDALGGALLPDNTDTVKLRSREAVSLLPNNPDIGGSGVGGLINFGDPNQFSSEVNVYSDVAKFHSGLSFKAFSSSSFLTMTYDAGILRMTDPDTGKSFVLDLDSGGITLGGAGLTIVGSDLEITTTGPTAVTFPVAGTLATLSGTETLTNKTIDATANTLSNISNAAIAANAAISYNKLSLGNSIRNSDIASNAAIVYSKLSLNESILDRDVSPGAAIAKSKLNLTNSINNTDIASDAAIAGSKVVPAFGAQQVSTSQGVKLNDSFTSTTLQKAVSGQGQDLTFYLPPTAGAPNQVLVTDGQGNLSWTNVTAAGGSTVSFTETWTPEQGAVRTIQHNLGTLSVDVSIIEVQTGELVMVSLIQILTTNTLRLYSSEPPPTTWRVVVQG
jgi:hypothetical protein